MGRARKIWMPAVEKFLQKNLGSAFTAKEIIENATLITKTYNNSYRDDTIITKPFSERHYGDRTMYNAKHVLQDKTHIRLKDVKMCPSTIALSQSLRGSKEIGRILRPQIKGPPLMEYFWRYEDEE